MMNAKERERRRVAECGLAIEEAHAVPGKITGFRVTFSSFACPE
jgi:hypothetical protein